MSSCPDTPPAVIPAAGEDAALGLLGRAGMVAVRVADLASPARRGPGKDGRTALTAAGAGKIRGGDLVVGCKPVAIARAVARRDGRVQAAGHPADHARLGVAEERLDALCGTPDTIGALAASVTLEGKVKGKARRAMTAALAIRLTLLMTLMPGADYAEMLAALLGDLAAVPWHKPYRVATATVACTWREALGPAPVEQVPAGHAAGRHRRRAPRPGTSHDDPVGDLDTGSIDGSLTRVPGSDANREAHGSAGTADDSSPYPQLRELRLSHASTRATLAVVSGPSGAAAGGSRDKGEAEQVLLDKALRDYPHVFTPGRIWIMDRRLPRRPPDPADARHRHARADPRQGRHHPAADRGLRTRRLLPGQHHRRRRHPHRPRHRVHRKRRRAGCPGAVLPDHRPARPRHLPGGCAGQHYHWRWIGSETCLKEAKSAISGAGPSTGPMLRSQSPALIAQEHAAWVISVELARAAARAAAAVALPARKGKRAGQTVHPREISFTAARRAVITSRPDRRGHRQPARQGDRRELFAAILAGLARPPRRRRPLQAPRTQDQGPARLPAGGPRLPTTAAAARISVCAAA